MKHDKQILYRFDLFGIPVSVKESFLQKGFDCTIGTACRCFKPSSFDGIQVQLIKMARGIIFVRTNLPQLAMTFESTNYIYGRSMNPWNRARAVGGSSGVIDRGEAAMQAARCSPIGIGSDIAGSIRIPAAFCGIFGLKPGVGRQTAIGEQILEKAAGGMINVQPSKGPLGRNIDDIFLMTKVLFNKENYDRIAQKEKDLYWSPVPMDEKIYNSEEKLRIGYIKQFDQMKTPRCMERAVEIAIAALMYQEKKGHEVVEFQIGQELITKCTAIVLQILASEGDFKSFYDNLDGEKLIEEYSLLEQSALIPKFLLPVLRPLLKLFGQNLAVYMLDNSNETDAYGYLKISCQQLDLQKQFLDLMTDQNINGLITPAFGLPAVKHGSSQETAIAAMYTWIWNGLNLPAGSMPITRVMDSEEDQKINVGGFDFIYKAIQDNMKDSHGLPVNVQIVTMPYQEELCLRIMKEIDQETQFHKYNQAL